MEKQLTPEFWQSLSEKEQRELYQMHRLLHIMDTLRQPEGCPWDREQTHESLQPYLLEETYEVLEQLEAGNMEGVEEELGDLLLQVVFHAQVAKEAEVFGMEDVARGIADKLVRRHPHIFADVKAADSAEVLRNWDMIKAQEKAAKGQNTDLGSLLDRVNSCQPALMEAQALQAKAKKVGFDWDYIEDAINKVQEEVEEVIAANASGDQAHLFEEIGDLLFAVVNVGRMAGCESELALRNCNRKFRRRFQGVERKARERGLKMEEQPLEVLDGFWEEVKKEERQQQ